MSDCLRVPRRSRLIMAKSQFDVVIVGAGHAGVNIASYLAKAKFRGSVALLSNERELPYKRPTLSKGFLNGTEDLEDIRLRSPEFWEASPVELMLDATVTDVDPDARTVRLRDGTALSYGDLVWAAGGRARTLAVQGAEMAQVHSIRTLGDAIALKTQLPEARSAVIVGGGYIGLESAAAFRQMGIHVTLVEAGDRVLGRMTASTISEFFHQRHRDEGVDVRLGIGVSRVRGVDGRVSAVVLSDGEEVPADVVIVGVGLQPNDEPLRAAGVVCDTGVAVDLHGRTSAPHIYAAGDCTSQRSDFTRGRSMRVESVQNANDQAKVVVASLIGNPAMSEAVPWFWTDQYDVKMKTAGLRHDDDLVVVRGDADSGRFSVLYIHESRLVAIDSVNTPLDFAQGRTLIESKALIDPQDAADITHSLLDLRIT